MTFHLDIPESVTSSLRLPVPEVEPRLRSELAIALYSQGTLPFGKACELADVSRYAFADVVGIPLTQLLALIRLSGAGHPRSCLLEMYALWSSRSLPASASNIPRRPRALSKTPVTAEK